MTMMTTMMMMTTTLLPFNWKLLKRISTFSSWRKGMDRGQGQKNDEQTTETRHFLRHGQHVTMDRHASPPPFFPS
jgi:hypothetical protein